jgi:hypothetical protein
LQEIDQIRSIPQQWCLGLEKQSCASLEDLVQSLPGNVSVYTATIPANLPFTFHDSPVACLKWIPPWAADVFHMCDYLQLDTSFRAVEPDVYTIPLAMLRWNVANCGQPS